MVKRIEKLFAGMPMGSAVGFFAPAIIISRLIGAIRPIVLIWLLGGLEMDTFGKSLVVINVFTPLLLWGSADALERYVAAHHHHGTLAALLRVALPLNVAIGGGVALLLGALAPVLSRHFVPDEALWGASLLAVAALVAYYNISAVLRGLSAFRAVALLEVLFAVLFTIAAIWAAAKSHSALWVILGYAASAALSGTGVGLLLAYCLRRWPNQQNPLDKPLGVWRGLARFSMASVAANLTFQVLLYISYYAYSGPKASSESGTYWTLWILSYNLLAISVLIWSVATPRANRAWEMGKREDAEQLVETTAVLVTWLLGAAALLLVVLMPGWVWILPSTICFAAQWLLPPLLAFFILLCGLGQMTTAFRLIERPILGWLSVAIGVLVNVIMLRLQPELQSVTKLAWAGACGAAAALAASWLLLAFTPYRRTWAPLAPFVCAVLLSCPATIQRVALGSVLIAGLYLVPWAIREIRRH